jgi:DtxR family manganese transport transcriptional regulator
MARSASAGPARGDAARARRDRAQELAQDYVELIAELIERTGEARAIDVARHLGVSHVTVNRAVQRLRKGGLVTTEPYRSIFLTPAGRRLARETRERHDLVVRVLAALGVPLSVAESDAEGIEHHVSRETLRAFRRFLEGRPDGAGINADPPSGVEDHDH